MLDVLVPERCKLKAERDALLEAAKLALDLHWRDCEPDELERAKDKLLRAIEKAEAGETSK